jgi:rubrerythrin
MGKPDFIEEDFACIYGPPPVTRVHKCKKCGYSWETSLMIDDEKWCPECGGEAPFGEGAGE